MPSAEHANPRAGPDKPGGPPNHVLNIVGVAIADEVDGRHVACSGLVQPTMSGRRQRADTEQQSSVEPGPEVRGVLSDENRRCGAALADTRKTVNWSSFPHGPCYLLDRRSPILLEPVAVIATICRSADSRKHLSLACARQGILRD